MIGRTVAYMIGQLTVEQTRPFGVRHPCSGEGALPAQRTWRMGGKDHITKRLRIRFK